MVDQCDVHFVYTDAHYANLICPLLHYLTYIDFLKSAGYGETNAIESVSTVGSP